MHRQRLECTPSECRTADTRITKRPFAPASGPHNVYNYSYREQNQRVSQFFLEVPTLDQDVNKARECDDRWQGIKPHSKRAGHIRAPYPEDYHPHDLGNELDQYSDHHQGCDHISKLQETKQAGDRAHHQQRDIRNPMLRMNARKYFEIVAIQGGSIWNARVAENQR